MIDLATEQLRLISEARSEFPGRPSIATLWRWRTKGIRGRRLESVLIGGRVFTFVEAIQRFAEQRGGTDATAIRSPKQRERSIAQAERELRSAGI